jgi:hypothetical protein
MVKNAKPASEQQQWVLDPCSPTGFRQIDVPDPPMRSPVFFDVFDFDRQTGPPDAAPPAMACQTASAGSRLDLARFCELIWGGQLDYDPSVQWGEEAVVDIDGQLVIRVEDAGRLLPNAEPFTIGCVHNLYEWSMLLGDLHPGRPLGRVGTAEEGWGDLRRNTIGFFNKPRAIFTALMAAYKSGKIKPILAWHEEEPPDKTLLRFRREDVLNVISALGADGVIINMLLDQHAPHTAGEQPADGGGAVEPHTARNSPSKRGPIATADKIRVAGRALIAEGYVPPETIMWDRFRKLLCDRIGVNPETRGYGLDTIQKALRPILKIDRQSRKT